MSEQAIELYNQGEYEAEKLRVRNAITERFPGEEGEQVYTSLIETIMEIDKIVSSILSDPYVQAYGEYNGALLFDRRQRTAMTTLLNGFTILQSITPNTLRGYEKSTWITEQVKQNLEQAKSVQLRLINKDTKFTAELGDFEHLRDLNDQDIADDEVTKSNLIN